MQSAEALRGMPYNATGCPFWSRPKSGVNCSVNGSVETLRLRAAQAEPAQEMGVGRRLLEAMGWAEGSGLGKAGQGSTEPILVQGQVNLKGCKGRVRKQVI